MWYFIISVLCIILLILIIPIRINIDYNVRHRPKNKKNNILGDIISCNDSYPNENYIIIYIFYFIPVLKIRLDKKKSKKNNKKSKTKNSIRNKIIAADIISTITNFFRSFINYEKTNEFYFTSKDIKKLNKHIKYKKFDFNLGINFFEPITNAYMIAIINMAINIFFAKNINQFNLKKTTYNTYISNEIYNLRLNFIISVSLITVIFLLFKALIKYFKLKNKIKNSTKSPQNKTLSIA